MSRLVAGVLCGISVLCVAAMLPPADGTLGAPGAPGVPAAGVVPQGAAASAPAGVTAPALLPPPGTYAGNNPLALFEITGSGSLLHQHTVPVAGVKAAKTKIKESQIAPCILASLPGGDSTCIDLLTPDAGGKAYLFFDSLDTWRIATNLDGTGAVTLTGMIDGKGAFTMAGTDADSDNTQIMVTGKVTFAKGTTDPTKLSGKITAVSMLQGHAGTGKFKSVVKLPF